MLLWSDPQTLIIRDPETDPKWQLKLDRPAVIGRSHGKPVPYLDPSYTSTNIFPSTGQPILRDDPLDNCVSRAHFQLRSHSSGVLFVNGVPGKDGGIRPPTNWTDLELPFRRRLQPGEEYVIAFGDRMRIRLPNNTLLDICVE